MKQRGLALLLALALTLALAACGSTEETPDSEADTAEEETLPTGSETDLAEEETPEEDTAAETIDEIEEEGADEPELGSRPADPAQKPQTGTSPADPSKTSDAKPVQKPEETQKPAGGDTASQPAQPAAEEPAAPETPKEETEASAVDPAAFAASVTGDQETWPAMLPVEGEALSTFYAGLSAIATKQCLVQMAMISASGDEIALVEVENSGDVQAVKDIFQARIDYQVGDGTAPGGAWYPAPTEMWKNESRIVSNGNFVMLVAHTGADSVVEQFNALFA